MKPFFKNPRLLAALGLVGALLAVGLWPSAIPVDFGTARRGPLRVTIDEEGKTRVREPFVVSAPVAGRVLRIELEPGDPVTRGETVLARFLPGEPQPLDARARAEARAGVEAAQAGLGQAQAERKRAQAADRLARSDLARFQDLAQVQVVSRQDLEAKQTSAQAAAEALRAAEFAVGMAQHQLEAARARLVQAAGGADPRPITLTSPIDGVVLQRYRESEAVVPAGESLLEVGDPRDLEIVSDLLSTDAVKAKPGDPVLVEQWGGDKTLRGRVRRVEPSGFTKISALGVEEQRVNVIVDFEDPIAAWKALGDAYRVEVRVVTWQSESVLKVPTSSLFRRGEKWAVFADEGGRARLRVLEIGHRNATEAEVLSGLDEGARVVIHPGEEVTDGSRIAPRSS